MIVLKVFGVLALVLAASGFTLWMTWREAYKAGYEAHRADMAENRAARRAEQRARSAMRGHEIAAFPGDDWAERLASTGELRELSAAGDMDSVRGHVAAFFRTYALHEWTRKKESAA